VLRQNQARPLRASLVNSCSLQRYLTSGILCLAPRRERPSLCRQPAVHLGGDAKPSGFPERIAPPLSQRHLARFAITSVARASQSSLCSDWADIGLGERANPLLAQAGAQIRCRPSSWGFPLREPIRSARVSCDRIGGSTVIARKRNGPTMFASHVISPHSIRLHFNNFRAGRGAPLRPYQN
jgi:hypothetical protein